MILNFNLYNIKSKSKNFPGFSPGLFLFKFRFWKIFLGFFSGKFFWDFFSGKFFGIFFWKILLLNTFREESAIHKNHYYRDRFKI
jgi:hypothetical protein